ASGEDTAAMDMPERVELAGWAEVWAAAPPDLASRHGIEAATIGGALCTAISEQPSTMLNRVVGLGLDEPATDDDLDAIEAFFARHRQQFYVSLHRRARPRDLPDRLAQRGFTTAYAWMKFTRDAEPPPAVDSPLRVEIAEPEHGLDFGDVVIAGYGLEPFAATWLAELPKSNWRCYLAYDGDEPAGAAALYVHDGTGYLAFAATRPEHRRKGAQSALLARRIQDALEAGCTKLVTETGERIPMKPSDSYRNILRFGFEEAYVRPNYLSPEPTTAGRSTAAR
ncbi:MAG TPA: GNAT family N-acetyltransferase, partial [Gaiellaceae bacterium]|nr:GNAT family N-acetyltransferase [Gaiellaceae bacterium]